MIHTLKVTLKQHTPLIHFQHDQDGATLRASEVKPKLDRYILTQLGNGDYNEGKRQAKESGWLVGKGEHPSLDYKMRIVATGIDVMYINEPKLYRGQGQSISDGNQQYKARNRHSDGRLVVDLKTYPSFFANMNADFLDPGEYKRFSYTEDPLQMFLTTRKEDLFHYINNNNLLNNFFLQNNFGTRQSKGFGSFYIQEEDDLFVPPSSTYHFSVRISDNVESYNQEFEELFNRIELFTKTLRGGINNKNRDRVTDFYFKSLAFLYCKEVLHAEWDKKRVKTEFYFGDSDRRDDSLSKQRRNHPDSEDFDTLWFEAQNMVDIRDLLGFSTNESWLSYNDNIEKKVAVIRDGRPTFPRRDDVLPVDRMRSPLLFKPMCRTEIIDDENFIVYYDIYLMFQDKEVGMERFKRQREVCFYSAKERDEQGKKRFKLTIPQNFTLESFFDFIFNQLDFDISAHVSQEYHDHEFYEILSDIYTQLKENLNQQ